MQPMGKPVFAELLGAVCPCTVQYAVCQCAVQCADDTCTGCICKTSIPHADRPRYGVINVSRLMTRI